MGLAVVVCGPAGVSGIQYLTASGNPISCGVDAAGNALELQVDSAVVLPDQSAASGGNGAAVGVEVGGAVLGVMAVAYGFRLLRNFVNSSAEG